MRELDDDEREAVLAAYEEYLGTIPEAKRQQSLSYAVKDVYGRSGFGIGSAGLQAYNLLVEGRTQALENDVVLSMKQAQTPAASRVVRDEKIRSYFEHEGHRTAVSQQALQAHADPWVGWCTLDGVGQVIKELSPYEADLEWDAVTEMDEMLPLVRDLGRATAKIHCVSDADSEHPLVDVNVEAEDHGGDRRPPRRVRPRPGDVGRRLRRADARGPPALRRRVPQRDDPRRRVRLARAAPVCSVQALVDRRGSLPAASTAVSMRSRIVPRRATALQASAQRRGSRVRRRRPSSSAPSRRRTKRAPAVIRARHGSSLRSAIVM